MLEVLLSFNYLSLITAVGYILFNVVSKSYLYIEMKIKCNYLRYK